MRRGQQVKTVRWGVLFCLVPALAGGLCDGSTGVETPLTYTIDWQFQNNFCDSVFFVGTDLDGSQAVSADVGPNGTKNLSTSALFTNPTTQVSATALHSDPQQERRTATVDVAMGRTTDLSVVVDAGGGLTITPGSPSSPYIAEAAPACVVPTTWTLDPPVGALSANFSDANSTGIGALTLNLPQSVQSGQAVTVGATFSASVMSSPTFAATEVISLQISAAGLGPTNTASGTMNIGTTSLTNHSVSGLVTVSALWTVPAGGPGNKLTFQISAGWQGFTHSWGLQPTVSYSKVP